MAEGGEERWKMVVEGSVSEHRKGRGGCSGGGSVEDERWWVGAESQEALIPMEE